MSTMNPPNITPQWVYERLAKGQHVNLDAPGWEDTCRVACPDCGKLVMSFKGRPWLYFEYGVASAAKHRCGQPPALEDHPHWLRLQKLYEDLDRLARDSMYKTEIDYDGLPASRSRHG